MTAARRVLGLMLALLALAAPAQAVTLRPVAAVPLTVHAGEIKTAQSRYVFGAKQVVVTYVYVNGREIPTSDHKAAATIVYAGDGTLVQVTVPTGTGPAHIKATTWLRTARIVVRFRAFER